MGSSSPNPNPSTNPDILQSFLFFHVLKDGSVHIQHPPAPHIPAADDTSTGVKMKDIQISTHISARVLLPPTNSGEKLPVLLYVHGGGFCMVSTFQADYTRFLTALAAGARVLIFSVEYRLFPDHPIPACYHDSWEALRWVASHSHSHSHHPPSGSDPWLMEHGDLRRLFIAGDSAGGNICHTLAVWAGSAGLSLDGMILIHPYFGEDDKMWMYMCPGNEGPRDRRMRPAMEDLGRLGCRRVLVLVAEKDGLKEAGVRYVKELRESGWLGEVEVVENVGREHCFHIGRPDDEEAMANLGRMVKFINETKLD